MVSNVDTTKILKFCSAVLYKYSLTSTQKGQIDLGRYKDVLRRFLFDASSLVPSELDSLIFRPLRYIDDDGVFAYRAPAPDRKYGVNAYRMMMGGLIFFVKLDRRNMSDENIAPLLIKAKAELPFLTVPAAVFEEFRLARDSFTNNQRLSEYLDGNP